MLLKLYQPHLPDGRGREERQRREKP